jgi:hypothetical protein
MVEVNNKPTKYIGTHIFLILDKTINYGERLYYREKTNKEKRILKATQNKTESYAKECANLTFKPKVGSYVSLFLI